MEKKCFKCNLIKPIKDFYKHPDMPDGHVNKCKECNREDNKKNWNLKRDEKREYDYYRHRYSINRLFMHKYSGIKTRCTKLFKNGTCKMRVYGTEFLGKKEWMEWCYSKDVYKSFIEIYNNWVKNDFKRSLTPSVDRIDNNKGYVLENIQWLTLHENVIKYNKHDKIYGKPANSRQYHCQYDKLSSK